MKKAAAILFSGVFFFNWYGYRLLTDFLQHQADAHLEARLDRQEYDESQLIEMRVPLHMPYQSYSTEFERFDGEIEIGGIHYKYVKRRVERGELVLLCLPNDTKMQLESASYNFFKLVHDLHNPSQNNSQQPGPSLKNPVTECWQQQNDWSIAALSVPNSMHMRKQAVVPASPYMAVPTQPPNAFNA